MISRRKLILAGISIMLPSLATAEPRITAPEIAGPGPWFNSAPLTLAQMKGRVVLVEFWTFGCYNCRNVMPYVKQWHERYAKQGLVVIGVHTPEFANEADPKRVKNFLIDHNITHPVVMDNDYSIWNRWSNRYWPAMYLQNKSGDICYRHFGEGRYQETEAYIQRLLQEN
jgi:thiol-disulfide isomerase/thioredoxin